MFLLIIVRIIIGGIIGWIVGSLLSKLTERYDDYRLTRMKKRTDDAIKNAFAPIHEMDSRQW